MMRESEELLYCNDKKQTLSGIPVMSEALGFQVRE